jgi:hypothetical protein
MQHSFGKVEGDGRIGRAAASGVSEELGIMMDGMAWPTRRNMLPLSMARLSFYNIPIGSEILLKPQALEVTELALDERI